MTISRKSYEKHRAQALRLLRKMRAADRALASMPPSILPPDIIQLIKNVSEPVLKDTRRQLADLRYAYYRGVDDDT